MGDQEQKDDPLAAPLAGAYYITPSDEDALTYDAVPAVDLSQIYTPVIPRQGEKSPVNVMKTVGNKYILLREMERQRGRKWESWMDGEVVEEYTLKVMRARYLIRVKYLQLYFDVLPLAHYERNRLLWDYFGGSLYQLPPRLLAEARQGWRRHLEAVKNAPPPDKNTVEGQIIEHLALLREAQEKNPFPF